MTPRDPEVGVNSQISQLLKIDRSWFPVLNYFNIQNV